MSDDPTQHDPTEAIDALAAAALGGQPDPVTLERLRRFWLKRSAAERRARRARRAAAAAVVVLAAGATWLAAQRDGGPRVATAPTAPPAQPKPPAPPSTKAGEEHNPPPVSRPSTPFERLAFAALSGGPAPPVARSPSSAPRSVTEQVADAPHDGPGATPAPLVEIGPVKEVCSGLLRVGDEQALLAFLAIVGSEAHRLAALDALAAHPAPPVDRLFYMLDHERRSVRRAAALALGRINGPNVTDRLIEIVTHRDKQHAEAWMALVVCRGDRAEDFLLAAAREPRLLGYYNAAVLGWSRPAP